MTYDPKNGGNGDEWSFFRGLDVGATGSGSLGQDSGGGYWGGPGPGPKSGDGGQARTPRISAAGFDIDTGKYYGPSPWDAVGFNPDTGAPIWPGQEKTSPSPTGNPMDPECQHGRIIPARGPQGRPPGGQGALGRADKPSSASEGSARH